MCPPPPYFKFLRKFCIISSIFGQNSSSQDTQFQNFCSLDPSFIKEICFLDPALGNPCGTCTHQKYSWVPPQAWTQNSLVKSLSVTDLSFILVAAVGWSEQWLAFSTITCDVQSDIFFKINLKGLLQIQIILMVHCGGNYRIQSTLSSLTIT